MSWKGHGHDLHVRPGSAGVPNLKSIIKVKPVILMKISFIMMSVSLASPEGDTLIYEQVYPQYMLHFITFPSANLLINEESMFMMPSPFIKKTSITGSAFVVTVKSKRNCGNKFLQWRSVFWCTWHPSDSWYDTALESHWLQALESHWDSHDPVRVCISYSMILKIKQNK